MSFSETLDKLKNNLPSQYRDNIIDYKTLKDGIEDVVKKLNKTGIYDLQTHSHLIMENDMKTNIDNHIRETFKKHKIDADDTIIEVFDDGNVSSSSASPIDKQNENENTAVANPEGNKEEQDYRSIASIYEKNLNYNFKEDLEDELKRSQVKLVKFINNAKDKDEIIRGLCLKYYQIFYALREMEQENGKKQLKSSLIVSISKVEPSDLDVQKFLDEITDQNIELFEQEEEEEEEETPPSNEEKNGIVEEKIDQEHLQKIKESIRLDSFVNSPEPIDDVTSPVKSTHENSDKILLEKNDIDILRLSKTPITFKIDEHMLGRTQRQDSNVSNEANPERGKRKVSMVSTISSSQFSSDEDKDSDEDMFDMDDDDDDVSIILPSSSNENIPKDKEIEPDPIAVKGDDEEMIKKRASIIQKRLSEYNCDDGISKEKFISLFNNNYKSNSLRKGSSHSCIEGKLSLSLSSQEFPDIELFEQSNSNIDIFHGVQNYWEIPVYSYYSYSIIPEDQRPTFHELSDNIPNTEEPESIEIVEIVNSNNKPEEVDEIEEVEEVVKIVEVGNTDNKATKPLEIPRQQSSPNNTAKNSPDIKGVEPVKESHNDRRISFSISQDSSTATLKNYGESQPVPLVRRKSSFTTLLKKFGRTKSSNDIVMEKKHSLNSKLEMMDKNVSKSSAELGRSNSNGTSLYVRKTRSHSFSYNFKNPFKRLNSKRSSKKSTNSISVLDPLNENKQVDLKQLNIAAATASSQHPNKEKRVEILLESDTIFLNKMIDIFKNLSLFEKDCKKIFDSNINAIKTMLKEVCTPGKTDTYPWRNILRLYRETDLWTHNGKVNTWEQATNKFEVFKAKAQSIISKFKMAESQEVFDQFLKLNQDTITLKRYYEINQTAIYRVLKDHDKDTKLSACEGLPCFISTDFFSDNACKHLTYEITNNLLSVIPDPEKYACPICQELAYKPIRLNCNHLFCLKCLIRAQKKNLDNCPVCRAKDAVKNATSKNLDKKLLNMFLTDFPREVRARKKMLKEITHQQELEEAREMENQPASLKTNDEENCIIM